MVFGPSTPLTDIDFCVIDTETTGGKAEFNRVIDVAVLQFKNGEIVREFQSLINPGRPIPQWISMLTGISDDMVKNAPSFSDISDELKDILNQGVFTAHNAGFDYGFIQEEYRRLGEDFERPTCCTLKMARRLYHDIPSKSLGRLCDHLLIDIWDRHRAHGDAEATTYVLKSMLKDLAREEGVKTWADLDQYAQHGPLQLPEGITADIFNQIPSSPGNYLFKDKEGAVVFKGNSKDLKRRIRTHFLKSNISARSNKLRKTVTTIECLPLQS